MTTPAQIVLVGPPGSGKSTVKDCLRGSTPRAVLIDPNDLAEERRALAQATAVLFVIGATDGIDATTTYLWREVAAAGLSRAIVVTKLDAAHADFDETCALIMRLFDPHGCLPFTLPVMNDDEDVVAFLDLATNTISQYTQSGIEHHDAEVEHRQLTEQTRQRLVDSLAALDFTVDDRWQAVTDAQITPIVGFIGPRCVGRDEVAGLLECMALSQPHHEAEWPMPVTTEEAAATLRVTIPLDYAAEVVPTVRRMPGLDVTVEDPGDGTQVITVRGAPEDLFRVPIDVHGMTDGMSHSVRQTTPR